MAHFDDRDHLVVSAAEAVLRRSMLRRAALHVTALMLGLPAALVVVAVLTLHHPVAPLLGVAAVLVGWSAMTGPRTAPVRPLREVPLDDRIGRED
jgi:1,4-dihydroxy-2-naphthoate octaprenyltransferase